MLGNSYPRTMIVLLGFVWLSTSSEGASVPEDVTFEERVAAQRAIEEVYYRHQLGAVEKFEGAVPIEVIEGKVRTFLKQSGDLQRWGVEVSPVLLDEELERIERHTRMPDRLQEIYGALGWEQLTIKQCFIRPLVVGRLWRHYAQELQQGLSEDRRAVAEAADAPLFRLDLPHGGKFSSIPSAAACPGGGDGWTPTNLSGAPISRAFHTMVWTGSLAIVWGGYTIDDYGTYGIFRLLNDGARYDPVADQWTPTSLTESPSPRAGHVAVWTGTRMIVWGGADDNGDSQLDTGGRYDPVSDSWTPTSRSGAPRGRSSHTATWTGAEMVVWGGSDSFLRFNTGGRYDPSTDTWRPTSLTGAPRPRLGHTAIWTGSEMIVSGGAISGPFTNTGGRYDPVSDTWAPLSTVDAPAGRAYHKAVWTGAEMLVWGGLDSDNYGGAFLDTGGRYDPTTDRWLLISTEGSPAGRWHHTAVWTGKYMMVWGGDADVTVFGTGGRYDPASDSWSSPAIPGEPIPRFGHGAVWTGREMIVWGGDTGRLAERTGARLYLDTSPDEDSDGYTVCAGDCDDADSATYPGAVEQCDGRDNDCDGAIPQGELDADEDGFMSCGGDCDDSEASTHPGAVDLPGNSIDEDCNGAPVCDPLAMWPNHGRLVSCVSRVCDSLVVGGLVSDSLCEELVSGAARAEVGKQATRRLQRRPAPEPGDPAVPPH